MTTSTSNLTFGEKLLALMVVACGIVAMIAIDYGVEQRKRAEQAEASRDRQSEWFKQQFETRVGYTEGFGNYDLISLDKGATWYNWVRDGGGITPADPKLVQRVEGFRKLTEYVGKHGPIDPTKTEGRRVLEEAGFTVESKKTETP